MVRFVTHMVWKHAVQLLQRLMQIVRMLELLLTVLLSSLHTANLSWQTRVGKPKLVCVNGTKTGDKHVCKLLASNRNVFADCFYAVHTHQLDFANTSLPTLVCRVKAA